MYSFCLFRVYGFLWKLVLGALERLMIIEFIYTFLLFYSIICFNLKVFIYIKSDILSAENVISLLHKLKFGRIVILC